MTDMQEFVVPKSIPKTFPITNTVALEQPECQVPIKNCN